MYQTEALQSALVMICSKLSWHLTEVFETRRTQQILIHLPEEWIKMCGCLLKVEILTEMRKWWRKRHLPQDSLSTTNGSQVPDVSYCFARPCFCLNIQTSGFNAQLYILFINISSHFVLAFTLFDFFFFFIVMIKLPFLTVYIFFF